jgi:tetratricopeptide (TPR) repeat protein
MASRSLKSQVAQLSRNMREDGQTWRDIARVIGDRYRVAPMVAFRLAHGWSQTEVADRYNEAWPSEHPKTGNQISYWENWRLDAPSGSTGRMPSYRELDRLAQLYECAVADLLDAPDYGDRDPNARPVAVTPQAASGHNESAGSSDPMLEEGDRTNRRDALKLGLIGAAAPEVIRRVLADAADEAMEFTRLSSASGVGAGTLDHLQAVLTDLDQAYYRQPRAEVFTVARTYRRRVHELIQGPRTLRETRELYVYAGWLDEELAWLALNLGDARAAKAYAIDCHEHADQAGHAELCGWAADVLSTIPMYGGSMTHAITPVRKGILKTPRNSPIAVRLRANAARIHARLGQRDECEEMLRQAREVHERLPSEAPLRFTADAGPVLEYTLLDYTARSYLWLGDNESAKTHAEQALSVIESVSPEQRWRTKEASARFDLGLALARLGEPEEAAAHGHKALTIGGGYRLLLTQVSQLDKTLTSQYPDLSEVREFHERYRTLSQAA